jgi:hypothetical protein
MWIMVLCNGDVHVNPDSYVLPQWTTARQDSGSQAATTPQR